MGSGTFPRPSRPPATAPPMAAFNAVPATANPFWSATALPLPIPPRSGGAETRHPSSACLPATVGAGGGLVVGGGCGATAMSSRPPSRTARKAVHACGIGCPCAAQAIPGRRLRTRHPHPQFLLTAPRRLYWSVPAGKWGSVCVRSLVTEGRPPDSGFQRHSSARNSHTCSSSGSSTSTLPGPPSQTLEMRHQDSDIGSSPFPSSFAPLRLRSRSPVALQGLEPPRFRRWWASTAGASYGDESTLGFPGSASAAGSRFLRLCLDARFALLSSGPTPRPSCSRRAAAGGAGGQQIYHA